MQQVKVMLHFTQGHKAFMFQTMHSVQSIRDAIAEVSKRYEHHPLFSGYTLSIKEMEAEVK